MMLPTCCVLLTLDDVRESGNEVRAHSGSGESAVEEVNCNLCGLSSFWRLRGIVAMGRGIVMDVVVDLLIGPFGIAVLVLVLIVLAGRFIRSPRFKGWAGERRIRGQLKTFGAESLHDVYLASARGVTQIDHLALVGGAIVVIETKNYGGAIYGDEGRRKWTQSFAGGRVKSQFQNPLEQNRGHVKAVESALGGGIVIGQVVFVGGAKFPKGMPEGVTDARGLNQALRMIIQRNPANQQTSERWKRLKAMVAETDRSAVKAVHSTTVKEAKAYADRPHQRSPRRTTSR